MFGGRHILGGRHMVGSSNVGFDRCLGHDFVWVLSGEISETWIFGMVVGNDIDLHELLAIVCVFTAELHGQA